jgi:SAM domain (Sterile alpha motif)
VATITEWLASLGMSEYAQRFADNRIDDVSILRDLTDQDLNGIGVPLGHRRKMLRAIGEMVGAAPTQMQPAPEPTPPDDAERRQLTVVFTDLVGSTALSTKLRWPSHAPSKILGAARCNILGAVVARPGQAAAGPRSACPRLWLV